MAIIKNSTSKIYYRPYDKDAAKYVEVDTLTLQILKYDRTNLWGSAKSITAYDANLGYSYTFSANEVTVSEPREAVWTVVKGSTTFIDIQPFDILISEDVYGTTAGMKELFGDTELPSALNTDRYIQRAADDMNMMLAKRFEIPIDTTDPQAVIRLKRINEELAAGQLILALGAPAEDNSLHNYGRTLIRKSLFGLKDKESGTFLPGLSHFANGEFALAGATQKAAAAKAGTTLSIKSPKYRRADTGSAVDGSIFDEYYHRFMT